MANGPRKHLEAVERRTGQTAKELDECDTISHRQCRCTCCKHLEFTRHKQVSCCTRNRKWYEIPKEGAHIWNCFWQLSKTRTNNGFGSNPIQYAEMVAWSALKDFRLRQFEIDVIQEMDRLYLDTEAREAKKK